jgi:lysozyme family protein
MGIGTAARILQAAINFLETGTPIVEDGRIGPMTLAYTDRWTRKDPEALHKTLNGFQFKRYFEIVVRNPSQEKFVRGWMKRIQYYRGG